MVKFVNFFIFYFEKYAKSIAKFGNFSPLRKRLVVITTAESKVTKMEPSLFMHRLEFSQGAARCVSTPKRSLGV